LVDLFQNSDTNTRIEVSQDSCAVGGVRDVMIRDVPSVVEFIRATIICDPNYDTEQKMRLLAYVNFERIELTLTLGHFVVYVDANDTPLGFAGIVEKTILLLFVTPSAQRRGIGSSLLCHLEKHAMVSHIATADSAEFIVYSSENAIRFYEKHGYRRTKTFHSMLEDVAIPQIEMRKMT
jgi:ribosomal protein S18 acetylase RimI-like enzyme